MSKECLKLGDANTQEHVHRRPCGAFDEVVVKNSIVCSRSEHQTLATILIPSKTIFSACNILLLYIMDILA
jgi:hypothetical protein